MESQPEDVDDGINFESKVLLALSRLQTLKNAAKKKCRRKCDISSKKVVEFLKANYSWLDGDIESQVQTALLSSVKTGIVCALQNGQYRLIGPTSKNMTSTCITQTSHGTQCSCANTLKFTLKTAPHVCCLVKNTGISVKKIARVSKKKRRTKKKPRTTPRKKSTKTNKEAKVEEKKPKCKYCLEVHPSPDEKPPKKSRKKCCPVRITSCIPEDKFSPRDELMTVVQNLL